MKLKAYIVLLQCSMLLLSCSGKMSEETSENRIVIDKIETKEIKLPDFVSSIEILPLISDSVLFGSVRDICVINNRLYVLDEITASIFIFDRSNGNFIKHISSRGNGPNEYINPVAIGSDKENVYLLDIYSILVYDKDLNPQKTIKLQYATLDFICTDNGFVLYCPSNAHGMYKYLVVDKTGSVQKGFVECSEQNDAGKYNWIDRHFVKSDRGQIYLSELYSNTIYSLCESRVKISKFRLILRG
jgi:hypothetical protein